MSLVFPMFSTLICF